MLGTYFSYFKRGMHEIALKIFGVKENILLVMLRLWLVSECWLHCGTFGVTCALFFFFAWFPVTVSEPRYSNGEFRGVEPLKEIQGISCCINYFCKIDSWRCFIFSWFWWICIPLSSGSEFSCNQHFLICNNCLFSSWSYERLVNLTPVSSSSYIFIFMFYLFILYYEVLEWLRGISGV